MNFLGWTTQNQVAHMHTPQPYGWENKSQLCIPLLTLQAAASTGGAQLASLRLSSCLYSGVW